MRNFVTSALLLLALGAAAMPAAAQEFASDMDFRGVSAVRVTMSPMSVESVDCNIDGNLLVRELQRQFEGEGLAASPTLDTLVVITVLSAREKGGGPCTSSLMLGTYKKASFFDDDAQWLRTGYVVVWQSALIVGSPPDTHLAVARDALARLGLTMLKEWRKANEITTPAVR